MFAGGKIRPIVTKHEEGAAFMADSYARVSGRLGVCCATTGPGATNALTGDRLRLPRFGARSPPHRPDRPVRLWKGRRPESSPLGIDIVDMYKDVTKAASC